MCVLVDVLCMRVVSLIAVVVLLIGSEDRWGHIAALLRNKTADDVRIR